MKENIDDMQTRIKERFGFADAKGTTTAAKIRALRDARKTQSKIFELQMTALKEQSVGAPDAAYVITEEELKGVVDSMIRFGALHNAK